MAYSKYVTQFKDKDDNVYGVMDEECRLSKADIITVNDTTPEPVKTFSDGADGMPMGLTVGIEPVQDLHGYDNPWPGGANTNNLFNESTVEFGKWTSADGSVSAATGGCISEFIPVTGGNAYGITFKGETPFSMSICEYDESGTFLLRSHYTTGYRGVLTLNASTTKVKVQVYATSFSATQSAEILASEKVMFYTGSTEPVAYSPYANICPISGRTEAEVTRTGKNLYGGTNASDFTIIYGGKNLATTIVDEEYEFKPGTYRCSFDIEGTAVPSMFIASKVNGVWSTPINRGQTKTFVFTVPENCEHLEIWGYGGTYTGFKNVQIEIGSGTETDYETPHMQNISIEFPSEAGTVYGGTLTVNADGTGTLVVDRWYKKTTWGDGTQATSPSNGFIRKKFATGISNKYPSTIPQICNVAPYAAAFNSFYLHFYVNDDSDAFVFLPENTSSDLEIEISGELATPQVYTLSAHQVETLKGMNNLWADTGDIKAVDYPADTKLYIDGKIAELQALILENISNS